LPSPDGNRAEVDSRSSRADSIAVHASTTQRASIVRLAPLASRYTTPRTRPSPASTSSVAMLSVRISQRPVATASGKSDAAIELLALNSQA